MEYMLNELNTDRLTSSDYSDEYGCNYDPDAVELTSDTFTDCATVTDVPYEECKVLVTFYNSTNGDGWCNNYKWLKTDKVCDWYGVTCSDGHVSGLYLNSEKLIGSIPSELGNLSNLEYLDMEWNSLTGSIPSELGNLSNLGVLSLSGNQLTGSIPSELGNLTNLWFLSLSINQLTGSIPSELGNLTNLWFLYMSRNQLTGSIPSELGNLSNLERLSLYKNQLTGSIPSELGNLSNLEYLNMGWTLLTSSIPSELGNLSKLKWLYLNDNQLTGSIPSELGKLKNLWELLLDNNQLTGSIPSELGKLTELNLLRLDNNQLTGSIPSELGKLTGLYHLRLDNNQLTGSIPSELGNFSNLKYLYLNNNQLCGEIPVNLKTLYAVYRLKLDNNHLTASNSELIKWLDRYNPGWDETQTPCPPRVQFSSCSYSVVENAGQAIITVIRTGDGAVSVEYATNDDAATNPDDYTQSSGTLSWSDGDDADKSFTVNIIDDSETENDETFIVSLGNPTGGIELGKPDTAIVTIRRNDSFCEKVTDIPEKECRTLISLYNSTDGENWVDNTGWNVADNPCDWYGVSCQDGRVRGLALGNNNLKGSISKKLSKLKELESLSLNNNNLNGKIPSSMMKLEKLTELDLNDNCLKTKVSKKLRKWLNKLNPGWGETQTGCLY
jgi:Leucine-rich repeat (LRR) protein